MIDASQGFEKVGKGNKLRACDIRKIADTIRDRVSIEKYSRVVSKDEIRKNDYNLNIPRYVDSSEPAEKYDLYATLLGGISKSELNELGRYWNEIKGLKEAIFRTDDGEHFYPKTENFSQIIQEHESSKNYLARYREAFSGFKETLKEDLIDDILDVEITAEREKIVQDIFDRLAKVELVDKYEAYQIFSDNWNIIAADLEMIREEGFEIINSVEPNMVVKNRQGNDDDIFEVQEGWRGRILPFTLVQVNLLKDEVKEINSIENRIADIASEYGEILDSLEEDEKDADYVKEDNSAFVNAEVKKYMKEAYDEIETDEIKILNGYLELSTKTEKEQYIHDHNSIDWNLIKKGASGSYTKTDINKKIAEIQKTFTFAADSLESKLQSVVLLIEEESALRSDLRVKKGELHIKTKELIENLDEDTLLDLLYKKWIEQLVIRLDELGQNVLATLEEKIQAMNEKYAKNLASIEEELNRTQEEFIAMSNKLVGDEKDIAGIKELQKLLEV